MVATFDPNTAVGLSEQNAIAQLKDDGYNELPSAQSIIDRLEQHSRSDLSLTRRRW